jgi:hypothetical protein
LKRIFCLGLSLVMMSGCAAMTTVDKSSIYNDSTGNYFSVNTVTVRDRTGTEMHHLVIMNNKDEIVDRATASGRGIVAGMTDGTVPALIQAGGIIGAAAVWPSDNYSGGNSSSGSGAVAAGGEGGAGGNAVAHGGAGGNAGAVATGGNAVATAKGGSAISGSVANTNVTNKPTFNNTVKNNVHNNVHNNIHNKGGWTPPGQDK